MKTPKPLSTSVKASIPLSLTQKVSKILHKLGLTHSQVIRLLYSQIELTNTLPFESLTPIRLLSKLIYMRRFVGGTKRRTGAYCSK